MTNLREGAQEQEIGKDRILRIYDKIPFPAASAAFSSFLKQNCPETDIDSGQDTLRVVDREEKLDRGGAGAPTVNETPTK